MKKTRRKHRGFKRDVSAVSELLESELDELMSVPEDVQENYELLREIKEILEELFMHVPISSARQKDSCSVSNDPASLQILEQPQLSSDEQLALESIKAAWGAAHELQNLLYQASPGVQHRFIAQLRENFASSNSH
jgi:hypothetical protein